MGLEMTKISSNVRLGMKCKDLILFFEIFVGIRGKESLGSGMKASFAEF